eukprot:TRINITY_DN14357_c0_g1_i7.p3 TRINITY_DN14357_c0_g1~~TRINITY_DN14357_c0_g1_i7.p3  ORF type:complete len:129 (-),score=14.45 TRINITY_DN14357_c0_g1_i7:155-541(-)
MLDVADKRGSVRCGRNEFGASAARCPEGAPAPCNEDDYVQHHIYDSFRNDRGCGDYSDRIRDRPVEPPGKAARGLRTPLPAAPGTTSNEDHVCPGLKSPAPWMRMIAADTANAVEPFRQLDLWDVAGY